MLKNKLLRFLPIIFICLLFTLLGIALLGQQFFGSYEKRELAVDILSKEDLWYDDAIPTEQEDDCLVLYNSMEPNSVLAYEDITGLLGQLKVDAAFCDISSETIPDLSSFEKIVMALVDTSLLGQTAYDILDSVNAGAGLMVYFPPQEDYFFRSIASQMGVVESGWEMHEVSGFRFLTDVMIGGKGKEFVIDDPFDSAISLTLTEDCKVHMVTTDGRELPLLWERKLGDGNVVFMNFGIMGKAYRGIYATGYSLLGDAFAWPVINGSAFYLDDFPSPVPSGTAEYIERDYGLSVGDFYTNIWWPDIMDMAEKYDIYYSGMVIEDYNNELDAPFATNNNTQRFRYFGNMLLKNGGEIGLHGYNHIPLCMENFEDGYVPGTYKRLYNYDFWDSIEDMEASINELWAFTTALYPEAEINVYVPPSNVLSDEARTMLGEKFPQIKAIASSYLEGDMEYAQEFEVAEDGVIEIPRVISGSDITSFMEIAALSELNLHYVNSHFQHPDDVLDEDRGAALGWEELKSRLDKYMTWLYSSAPDIRNMTATEMAGAVQRYYYLDVEQKMDEDGIVLELSGLQDEGWLFIRINEGASVIDMDGISGGEICSMGGNLYLIKANDSHIEIPFKE